MENKINSIKTVAELETFRKEINEACDTRLKFLKKSDAAVNLSNKNFGYIKECFEHISPSLFNLKEGRALINKYVNTLKSNKSLETSHRIYESIRKANKNCDIDFFLNGLTESITTVNHDDFVKGTKELGMILAEGYMLLDDETRKNLPTNETKYYNAVEFIAENKKSSKNLSTYSMAIKILREKIENNVDEKNVFENKDIDNILTDKVREFNEKYIEKLDESEIAMVKELAESTNHEELFNKYKNICMEKLLEAKKNFQSLSDVESANKITNIYEQITNKEYKEDTINTDICNFIKMSNICE